MAFLLNGSAPSLVPYRQKWVDTIAGIDHAGAPVLAGFRTAQLDFDNTTYANYQQWAQYANTGASIQTITLLNVDSASYTAFSGIFLRMTDRPDMEAGYVGQFTIYVDRCAF